MSANDAMMPEYPISAGLQHSPSIGKLAEALALAQKDVKPVKKESKNPFYKSRYADLAVVIEATKEALAGQGLAIIQSPHLDGKNITVTTLLVHSSGEWIRDDLTLPMAKFDAQGAGSAITYARRYSYQSFVNVAAEDDDDGNRASQGKETSEESEQDFDKRTEGQRLVSEYQIRAWNSGVEKGCRTKSQIAAYFKKLGISTIDDMPRSEFNEAIKWVLNPSKSVDLTEELKDSVQATGKGAFPVMFENQ